MAGQARSIEGTLFTIGRYLTGGVRLTHDAGPGILSQGSTQWRRTILGFGRCLLRRAVGVFHLAMASTRDALTVMVMSHRLGPSDCPACDGSGIEGGVVGTTIKFSRRGCELGRLGDSGVVYRADRDGDTSLKEVLLFDESPAPTVFRPVSVCHL